MAIFLEDHGPPELRSVSLFRDGFKLGCAPRGYEAVVSSLESGFCFTCLRSHNQFWKKRKCESESLSKQKQDVFYTEGNYMAGVVNGNEVGEITLQKGL